MVELKLYDLPDGVLARLLDGELSWAAIMLYKCGNVALNTRLCRGGITSIDMCDYEPKSTSRWPRCLKEFRALRSISLFRTSGPLATAKTLRAELSQLSPSLKSLKLRTADILKVFFNTSSKAQLVSVIDDEEPPTKRSKRHETKAGDAGDQIHEERWNMDLAWPQLEELTLTDSYTATATLTAADLALLPRSLTSFSCKQAICPSPDMSVLPPRLRKLKLAEAGITVDALPTLPRSLTSLGHSLSRKAVAKWLQNPSLLPPAPSDRLFIDFCRYASAMSAIASGTLKWPENISVLSIQDPPYAEVMKDLPKEVTDLTILTLTKTQLVRIGLDWVKSCIAPMSKLTSLYIDFDLQWNGIDASTWPSTLTEMDFASGLNFSDYHRLPRSLTDLVCLDSTSLPSTRVRPTVGELAEIGRQSLLNTHTQWETIKESLKKIGDAKTAQYIADVEAGHLYGLPLSLRSVTLARSEDRNLNEVLFPPLIERLDVSPDPIQMTSSMVSRFPPSLTVLNLSLQENARMLILDNIEALSSSDTASNAFYNLKNLSHLDLDMDLLQNSGPVIKLIPRGILSLSLRMLKTRLEPEDLEHLPPNLVTLHLESLPSRVEKHWLYTIPRSVTRLSLQAMVLGTDLVNLPPNVQTVSLAVYDATLDHVLTTPKSVRQFTLAHSNSRYSAQKNQCLDRDAWLAILQAFRPFNTIMQVPRQVVQDEIDLSMSIIPSSIMAQENPARTEVEDDGDYFDRFDEEEDEELDFGEDSDDSDGDDGDDGNDDGGGGLVLPGRIAIDRVGPPTRYLLPNAVLEDVNDRGVVRAPIVRLERGPAAGLPRFENILAGLPPNAVNVKLADDSSEDDALDPFDQIEEEVLAGVEAAFARTADVDFMDDFLRVGDDEVDEDLDSDTSEESDEDGHDEQGVRELRRRAQLHSRLTGMMKRDDVEHTDIDPRTKKRLAALPN